MFITTKLERKYLRQFIELAVILAPIQFVMQRGNGKQQQKTLVIPTNYSSNSNNLNIPEPFHVITGYKGAPQRNWKFLKGFLKCYKIAMKVDCMRTLKFRCKTSISIKQCALNHYNCIFNRVLKAVNYSYYSLRIIRIFEYYSLFENGPNRIRIPIIQSLLFE